MSPSFCPACGAHLEPDARFCGDCGHEIHLDGPETPVTAGPAPTPAAGVQGAAGGAPPTTPSPPGPGPDGPKGRRGLLIVGLVVLAVLILGVLGGGLLLTRGGDEEGEIFLESSTSNGPDPFTDSTATGTGGIGVASTSSSAPSATVAGGQTGVETTQGSTPGLYGGTLNKSSCNRQQQIAYLQANPQKAAAFASVLGISSSQIPDYLNHLTPVILLRDTRVTNHGFANGAATSRQSVLQAGTAVLVDEYGTPRVRCYCGNPLTPPTAVGGTIRYQGDAWPGLSLDRTVVVVVSVRIDIFILIDIDTGRPFERKGGTDGTDDHTTDGTTASTTTTGRPTTTIGGGDTTLCAPTASGAVNTLLEARRRGDRVAAAVCGSETVLDYVFGLSDDFVTTLAVRSCEATDQFGPTQYNDEVDACSLTNNAIFAVPRVARPPAENWKVSIVVLVDGGGPSSTTTTSGTQACANGRPDATPVGPGQQVIVDYFGAINAGDYATAFGYLGPGLQASYGGVAGFTSTMSQHVSCVRVTGIADRADPEGSATPGTQWYEVTFDAEYITPFPAGSGSLPLFYKTQIGSGSAALIIEQATGL